MSHKYTAGALFAGIGGFCLGFEKAGIKTAWAVEMDDKAVKTYTHNLREVKVIAEDIKKVSVESHNLQPVDVLHAGFPCQSFSLAGDKKGFDDERGMLFFEIIRIIKEFGENKPSVIVFENSPYLKVGDGGSWFIEIEKQIKKAGYWFKSLNAMELDTFELTTSPQKRNRLFMVAFSIKDFKNGNFVFPEEIESKTEKILSDFVGFDDEVDESYYLSEDNRYFNMIDKYVDDPYCLYQLRKYIVRVKSRNVCPTLTANMGQGGHNVPFIVNKGRLRKLTEYECARLQGFPDSFVFPEAVSKSARYTQIGNAVSVPVAYKLARNVIKKIMKERRLRE